MAPRLPSSGDTGDESYTPLAEINVTPMVDVMLVLLVIFMVAAPLLTVGVPINLPKTNAAQVTQGSPAAGRRPNNYLDPSGPRAPLGRC